MGDKKHIQKSEKYEQMFIIENEIKKIIRKFEEVIKIKRENTELATTNIYGNIAYLENKFLERNIEELNKEIFKELFEQIFHKIIKKMKQNGIKFFSFLYYLTDNLRVIRDIRYRTIPRLESTFEIVHIYDSVKNDLNKFLVYHDYSYLEKFKEIINWINENVLEDKEITGIDRPEFKTIIETKSGDEHGLELLSIGEKSLLIIAIELYLIASENTIILIDEIDKSLHPEYQTKIMKLIKKLQEKFNYQIIVSSHSRFIWREFEEKAMIDLTGVVL